MNLFVADPEWGWWIVGYFFLGGIAAGAYFLATLIDLLGQKGDGELARMGYWIAFPLVCLCGLLLILDLHEPARFWHMLLKSEIAEDAVRQGWPAHAWGRMAEAPLLKSWSPMSLGSWALFLFGFCSGLSFLGSLWSEGRIVNMLRHGIVGRFLQIIGSLVGFFVAAYTGALLTATNQPVWSDSVFIAPLFLASAGSTGLALMIVMARYRGVASEGALHRMERADLWVLSLELVALAAFLTSLGSSLTLFLSTWAGMLFVLGALTLGVLIPLALHLRVGISGLRSASVAAVYVLIGGLLLRIAVLRTAPELLTRGPAHLGLFSPEDNRTHGTPGADAGNRLPGFQPEHSKLTNAAP